MDTTNLDKKIREVLALHVTSTCNLACSHCIMQWQMNSAFTYHMSLQEIEELIHFTKLSNYKFQRITISGGEPFLWKNLEEGLALLAKSGITEEITVFTNAVFYKKLNPAILKNITTIRVSFYDHLIGGTNNSAHIEELRKMHPNVVVVSRTKFLATPSEPVKGFEPVDCLNLYTQYYNHRIFACAHAESLAIKIGSTTKTGSLIGINYLDEVAAIRKGQHKDLCSICVSNNTIRHKLQASHNVNTSRALKKTQLNKVAGDIKRRTESIMFQNLTKVQAPFVSGRDLSRIEDTTLSP